MFPYILIIIEILHVLLHCGVLFRIYLLPFNDLATKRWYFALDCLSPVVACLWAGHYPLLVVIHTAAHIYYVLNWNWSYYAIRIMEWSSLEYTGSLFTFDMFLTIFDISSHLCVIFLLCGYAL